MTASYDKNTAVVVLPPAVGGRISDPSLRGWLAQADLVRNNERVELLASILRELDRPYPTSGLAALRMWGETGDRPTSWIAAADPVYLEPRLDNLCLHALRRGGVSPAELRPLIDHLQRALGGDSGFGFARLGSNGYLTSQQPIASASVPPYVIDQRVPSNFLPQGDDVASHRNLLSEIEMALHDHEINAERESAGKFPVNSLWIWGGGYAPEQQTEPHPPLFSDDALLTGYWQSMMGLAESWPGNIAACLDVAVAGFVATLPEFDDDDELLESCLRELRGALSSNRLSSLILLFRDDLRAEVRRSHSMRLWRRRNTLLEAPPEDSREQIRRE
ncbi:MAG: hypothetical protein OER97_03410 [Gammaproteobacteria bacterium]|nr:hypothetical protein [Gammaproteobacteria bacterium]